MTKRRAILRALRRAFACACFARARHDARTCVHFDTAKLYPRFYPLLGTFIAYLSSAEAERFAVTKCHAYSENRIVVSIVRR